MGKPAHFFPQWEKIAPPLCSNLFKQSCLDMGYRFFFTGSDFLEPDHLRLLILHLLPHGEMHLEELITVVWRFEFSGLHPEWQCSVEMRVLNIEDVDV